MRFIPVHELRANSSKVWRQLEEERELVLTKNGKPFAILMPVSEDSFEETLKSVRRARATLAVDQIQRRSVEAGLDRMTLDEINAEIEAVRKKRRK